jgi:hypothetical protein
MVRRPFARGATAIRVVGKTLSPFIAVPFLNTAESRPDSVDGVFGIRTKISQFSPERGSAPGSIDDPTRANGALAPNEGGANSLAISVVQLEVRDFGRTP